jgi:hypothetical protein
VPQESRSPQAAVVVLEARADSGVVAVEHHEDEADSATEVDVEDPEEGSAEAVAVAVASQEAEAVVASREVVLAAVVASADADVEATKAAQCRFEGSRRAPLSATQRSILSLSRECFECHDYYQPIPRSSFDGVWELRWDLCKRPNIWRHVGNCLRRLLGIHIYQLIFKVKKSTECHMRKTLGTHQILSVWLRARIPFTLHVQGDRQTNTWGAKTNPIFRSQTPRSPKTLQAIAVCRSRQQRMPVTVACKLHQSVNHMAGLRLWLGPPSAALSQDDAGCFR